MSVSAFRNPTSENKMNGVATLQCVSAATLRAPINIHLEKVNALNLFDRSYRLLNEDILSG
jgi:hypothetical protein